MKENKIEQKKVVIISGASSGIGLKTAEYFADRGLVVNVQAKRQNAVFIGDEETDEYGWCDWEEKEQPIHKASKVYPNDPCPCGSGKKYKKCCGR